MQLRERSRLIATDMFRACGVQRPVNYGVGTFVRVPGRFRFPPRSLTAWLFSAYWRWLSKNVEVRQGHQAGIDDCRAVSLSCHTHRSGSARRQRLRYTTWHVAEASLQELTRTMSADIASQPPAGLLRIYVTRVLQSSGDVDMKGLHGINRSKTIDDSLCPGCLPAT
jgi:hypothetical protein